MMGTRNLKLLAGAMLLQALLVGSAGAAVNLGGPVGGSSPPAGPDPMFTFTFDIGPDSGTGILSTVSLGGGQYLATSGTLHVTSGAAIGTYSLLAGGPAPFLSPSTAFIVDDVATPAVNPTLDVNGLLFTSGSTEINIWGNSPDNYSFWEWTPAGGYVVQDQFGNADRPASFVLSAAPESATWAMMLLGVFGIGFMLRRSRSTAAMATA
jgi:hypothetical protein